MKEDELESITIEVPKDIIDDILFMMTPEMGEINKEEIVAEFALLGFEHFYEWISGKKRHRTLTEQYIGWLENVYMRLLPEDEVPAYSRLYNRFNIPYGQAGYIIRVLNERELPHLRRRARAELKRALERASPKAAEAIGINRLEQVFAIRVSSLANRELRSIANALYRKDEETLLPERSYSYGDIKTVMLPAKTLVEVLKELE